MKEAELSTKQAKKIFEAIHPTLGFLAQLERSRGTTR